MPKIYVAIPCRELGGCQRKEIYYCSECKKVAIPCRELGGCQLDDEEGVDLLRLYKTVAIPCRELGGCQQLTL